MCIMCIMCISCVSCVSGTLHLQIRYFRQHFESALCNICMMYHNLWVLIAQVVTVVLPCYMLVYIVYSFNVLFRGVPRIWQGGGGKKCFFQNWKFACREATCCSLCALLGGVGGMILRENFFKWSNLVRFGVYLDQILSLKKFLNYHFLYKKFKNSCRNTY